MFKYLQRFAFLEKEENLAIDGWVKYIKTTLELLGQGDLIGNIDKVVSEEV